MDMQGSLSLIKCHSDIVFSDLFGADIFTVSVTVNNKIGSSEKFVGKRIGDSLWQG